MARVIEFETDLFQKFDKRKASPFLALGTCIMSQLNVLAVDFLLRTPVLSGYSMIKNMALNYNQMRRNSLKALTA